MSASEAQTEKTRIGEQIQSLDAELKSLARQEHLARKEDERLQAQKFDGQKDAHKLESLESEVANIESKLGRILSRQQVFYNPTTADGKQVWLVQLEGDRVLVAPAATPGNATVFSQVLAMFRRQAFSSWLSKRSTSADFIFLLVRPDGAADLREFRELAESRGFTTGFDLIAKGQSAVGADKETNTP